MIQPIGRLGFAHSTGTGTSVAGNRMGVESGTGAAVAAGGGAAVGAAGGGKRGAA
ncbi:MAG TPA: hypothetical protein VGO65_05115 [Pseudolysinimonas sp.]|jgi:hypothetical protein|nr:hypothetical protein [Pseudolysinimonas sp.]